MNIDQILTYLRDAFRRIEEHKNAYFFFDEIATVYEGLRRELMRGDIDAFHRQYAHFSATMTSGFDLLMSSAYEVAGATTYEQFFNLESEKE